MAPKTALVKVDLSKQGGTENIPALRHLNYLLTTLEKKHNASAK